jgi:hypothetical protein
MGPGPNEASNLGKGLGGKPRRLNKKLGMGHYLGVPPGDKVLGSGLAPWVLKPLGEESPAPLQVWMMCDGTGKEAFNPMKTSLWNGEDDNYVAITIEKATTI